ncbi:MAG TPA: DUF1015 family protein [Pyrinomonadaceae bacterium]|nr:DUF1015 family protein [Pyrinomonadaceae bacterium]
MAVIRPFRALRPQPERAKDVASVPYDVVNTDEARALANGNPFSFLHVSRPEIDLPTGTDIHSDAVYRKAVENFEKLIAEAPLEKENEPSLYLYRLVMGDHEQIGLVACASIDEYDNGTIRKHERTRRDKEDDRTRHMLMLKAQTGPVFLTYRARPEIDEQVSAATAVAPLFDLTAPDGVRHTIWRLSETESLVKSFESVPLLYIADGHHRAASASRARAELKQQSFAHTGNEDYNYFLTVIFPDSQVRILAYNRTVQDLNGLSREEFLNTLRESFTISENASPEPPKRGHWSMYLGGKWYGLQLSPAATLPTGTVAMLDVSILQDRLLDPILGIKDVRTDKRVDFIGGLRGTKELERLVNEGKAAVAFSLHPTTVEELLMVSDANEIMPPKSTWFEPKLRDGLLIHTI